MCPRKDAWHSRSANHGLALLMQRSCVPAVIADRLWTGGAGAARIPGCLHGLMHLKDQQKLFIWFLYISSVIQRHPLSFESAAGAVGGQGSFGSGPNPPGGQGGCGPGPNPPSLNPPIALSVVPLEVMGAWAQHLTLQEVWGASAPGQTLQRPHSPTRVASATPCRKGTSTDGG